MAMCCPVAWTLCSHRTRETVTHNLLMQPPQVRATRGNGAAPHRGETACRGWPRFVDAGPPPGDAARSDTFGRMEDASADKMSYASGNNARLEHIGTAVAAWTDGLLPRKFRTPRNSTGVSARRNTGPPPYALPSASAATFSSANRESASSVAFSSFRVSASSFTASTSPNCLPIAISEPYDAIS
jgi:hypothetical protein